VKPFLEKGGATPWVVVFRAGQRRFVSHLEGHGRGMVLFTLCVIPTVVVVAMVLVGIGTVAFQPGATGTAWETA
jgi:hypothetical protein